MTALNTTTAWVSYDGNDVGYQFNTTFWIANDDEITVDKITVATGVVERLVLDTDYTVTNLDDFTVNGAQVSLIDEVGDPLPLATGETLAIYRNPTLDNPTDLTNANTIFPSTMQDTLNYVTSLTQALQLQINRAIRFMRAGEFEPGEMEYTAADFAGHFLAFDETGEPLPADPVEVPVTPYCAEGLLSEDEDEFLTYFGLASRIFQAGGAAGAVPRKNSTTDYDFDWALPIPAGGTAGQVVRKASATEFAVEFAWAPTRVGTYFHTVPIADEIIFSVVFTDSTLFPSGLATSRLYADTAATAETVFLVKKNGSNVGTITVAIGGQTGTFAMASDQTFAAGDRLTVAGPNTPDATIAGIHVTLKGRENSAA